MGSSMQAVRRRRLFAGISLSAALVVGAVACGGEGSEDGFDGTDDRVPVATSTNVWADVVEAVGGDHVEVSSIIEDSTDPHSYQAAAADAATVNAARLLVYNGGGYDDFFVQLAESSDAPAVVAVDQADHGDHGDHGEHSDHGEHGEHSGEHGGDSHAHGNEHVWYDLRVMSAVADSVAAELSDLLPERSDTFERNAADFAERIDELGQGVERIAQEHAGAAVVATEPIAHYLFVSAGLEDITPHEFTAAVENETDVPATAQQRMLELVSDEADVVVRNVQTATPATENVIGAAQKAGTPVVDVTETLPEGQSDYISWMGGQIDALAKALDK